MPPPVVGLTSPAASPIDEHPIAVGAVDRAERQDLHARRRLAASSMPHRSRDALEHARVAADGVARRHDADAHDTRPSGRTTGTAQAKPPGATSRPKCSSTSPGRARRQLALRGVQVGARQAEAERAAGTRSSRRRRASAGARCTPRRRRPARGRRRHRSRAPITRAPTRISAPAALRALGERAIEGRRDR